MGGILYTVAVILVVLWIAGFVFAHVVTPIIHLLLIVALAVVVYNVATGRKAV
jgi:hypothetical protein